MRVYRHLCVCARLCAGVFVLVCVVCVRCPSRERQDTVHEYTDGCAYVIKSIKMAYHPLVIYDYD